MVYLYPFRRKRFIGAFPFAAMIKGNSVAHSYLLRRNSFVKVYDLCITDSLNDAGRIRKLIVYPEIICLFLPLIEFIESRCSSSSVHKAQSIEILNFGISDAINL